MATTMALTVLAAAILLFAYTYVVYPALLWFVGLVRPARVRGEAAEAEWPTTRRPRSGS